MIRESLQPMMRERNIIQGIDYKLGYRFSLIEGIHSDQCKLTLHVFVNDVDRAAFSTGPMSEPIHLTVAKGLPWPKVHAMGAGELLILCSGLALWWEMHELAEWFRPGGRRFFDTYDDHNGGVFKSDEENFYILTKYGELIQDRFSRGTPLKFVEQG